jgi:hypothetical protein
MKRMVRRWLPVLSFLAGLPPFAEAADLVDTVARGAKLRARLEGRTVEGTFVRQNGSTLFLRDGAEEVAIDTRAIERLELSRERRASTLEGWLVGMGVGALAGVIIAAGDDIGNEADAGAKHLAGGLVGAATAGFFGILVGSGIERDRWVDLPREAYAATGGGSGALRVGWSVRW